MGTLFVLSEKLPGVSTFVGGVGVDTVLFHRKLFWDFDLSGGGHFWVCLKTRLGFCLF